MADYVVSGVNIGQNYFNTCINMSKTYAGLIEDNINEISEMMVNSLRVFEPTAAAPMLTTGKEIISYTPPNMEYEDDESRFNEWRKLRDDLTVILQIANNGT
jgi:hypothetical protein